MALSEPVSTERCNEDRTWGLSNGAEVDLIGLARLDDFDDVEFLVHRQLESIALVLDGDPDSERILRDEFLLVIGDDGHGTESGLDIADVVLDRDAPLVVERDDRRMLVDDHVGRSAGEVLTDGTPKATHDSPPPSTVVTHPVRPVVWTDIK